MTEVACTFSEIKEQTPKDLLQNSSVAGVFMDMTATFEHNCLTVTTKGGQEFLVNTRLPLLAVYPLEDGLILKCKFKSDLPNYGQQATEPLYCYMTLSGHPLNDIHPLGLCQPNQTLINSKIELMWVSELIPFIVTYEQGTVSFNLVCRNFQEDSDNLFDQKQFQSRNQVLQVLADQPTHKLRNVYQIKMASMPTKIVVTQGASLNQICVSLFSARERTVYGFKSHLSLDDFKPFEIPNVIALHDISFLRMLHPSGILNPEISNTVGQTNMNQFSETRELKYFKKCLSMLGHEQVCLNGEGDKLTVYYGGSHPIYTAILPTLTEITQPAVTIIQANSELVTRVQYVNGKHVDLNFHISVADPLVAQITHLIQSCLTVTDQIAYLKRLVKSMCLPGGQQFYTYTNNFIELVCGAPSLKTGVDTSPMKKISSPVKSPLKSSPLKKFTTTSSPTKQSSLTSPIKKSSVKVPAIPIKLSAFQQMLEMRQQTHGSAQESELKPPKPLSTAKTQLLMELFKLMHLMYLDVELQRMSPQIEPLKKLMVALASQLSLPGYVAFYLGKALPKDAEEPISLSRWLSSKMSFEFPILFERTRIIIRLYEVMHQAGQRSKFQLAPELAINDYQFRLLQVPQTAEESLECRSMSQYLMVHTQLHLYEKVLFVLNEERFSIEQIELLPYQVQLPMHEILRYTRTHLNEVKTQEWPVNIYKLIQREDIINNLKQHGQGQQPTNAQQLLNKLGRQSSVNFALQWQKKTSEFDAKDQQHQVFQDKFVDDLIGGSAEDFGKGSEGQETSAYVKATHNDTRHQEVEFLLRSDCQMKITSPSQTDLTEEDRLARSKLLLEKMFRRQLSKCIGRGALTLGTEESLPTQKLDIPKICQSAFVAINVQNQLDESEVRPAPITMQVELKTREEKDLVQWPEFHNGVASALRIAQSSFNQSAIKNARNWIMYHRPQTPKNEHGGFLLGLGLLGQLDSLQPTDVYQHLKTAHDSTTIGILLGRAASKIGKMDESDSRMMCLHIPALLPHTLSVDYSLAVQSAAVVGAGLLYQATSNRQITEMLLSQICKKPSSDKLTEREGYALASGLALGMVNLGAGRQTQSQSATALLFKELDLDQRLIRFVEGGKTMPLPRSMLSQIQLNDNFKSSAIKENDMVNTSITAPGALISLALIYLKTNNTQIADRIKIPHTFEAMDYVTPHTLVLKVLARNLILWDSIDCSQEWIRSQIPDTIRFIFESESQNQLNQKLQKRIHENDIDFAAVALCVANIKAAAVLSIGFKYAGTSDKRAKDLILEVLHWFRKKVSVVPSTQPLGSAEQQQSLKFSQKNQMDKNTADSSLCICAMALSMVMAGSCDIECFRALRVLRKRFEQDMNFGYNQAIFLSFGILFLSNGQFTLSRSDKAIAGLISAVYPIFPSSPQDNRHHLQALRHFYVFALETRLLQAKDIDTGAYVKIDVEVEIQQGDGSKQILHLKTPEIINGSILQIEAKNNPQYHDLLLHVIQQEHQMQVDQQAAPTIKQGEFMKTDFQQIIYVKHKQNSNSDMIAQQEKVSLQQFLAYNPTQEELNKQVEKVLQCLSKIKDPSIQAFLKTFCSPPDASEILTDLLMQDGTDIFSVAGKVQQITAQNQTQTAQLTLLQLYECYAKDQIDSLPILLNHLLREPLAPSFVATPDPLILPNVQQVTSLEGENHDLAVRILDALVKAGEKDTVEQYRASIRAGAPLSDHLLEIHHALQMCGFDFNDAAMAL